MTIPIFSSGLFAYGSPRQLWTCRKPCTVCDLYLKWSHNLARHVAARG